MSLQWIKVWWSWATKAMPAKRVGSAGQACVTEAWVEKYYISETNEHHMCSYKVHHSS